MRRTSYLAQTVALGTIADDIFGALMSASPTHHDAVPAGSMIAYRPDAMKMRLAGFDERPVLDKLAA